MHDDQDPREPGREAAVPEGEERFRLLIDSIEDYAIFMLDTQGRVTSWNTGALRLKQYEAHEIVGRSFETFYPPEAVASGWPREELRRAATAGRFEDEGWRLRKDGSAFWANVVITALRGPGGVLQGYAKVTRDLSERRQHEEQLRRSEEQFRLLLESVKDYAIYLLDPGGHVMTWNSGAHAITGYAAAEVLGRHFSIFFTPEDAAAGLPAQELAAAARDGGIESQGRRVRQDGSLYWSNVVITPVRDPGGALRGYAKVTRDLSERQRMADLEQSSERMQQFIAMLAHELRNPLAPIRNAVGILQLHRNLPAPVQRVGEIVGRQVDHLTRLVDDLLDVGRIVTGKIVLRTAPLDYREVVQLSVEAVQPLIEQHGHRLVLDLPSAPVALLGDATRLSQALQNLLQNAARYTPAGGEIGVAVSLDGSEVLTTVRDTGIGIAPDALARIFELFVQEPDDRSPNESGLGIGLSLTRALIEQHGGRVAAHSEGRGRGSTFSVRLPLAEPATQDRAAQGTSPAAEPLRALRVLVVDDNHDSTRTMVDLLALRGHEARGAYGAQEALAAAEAFRPEVVLLDLNLPDGDGFSVLAQLRDRLPQPLYVAAMTGYGQQKDLERTLASGFQAHLTKPVNADHLTRALAQAGLAKAGTVPACEPGPREAEEPEGRARTP